MYLATRGTGTLLMPEQHYELSVGTLFFGFPGVQYEIKGSDDFAYMYISFMGTRAFELTEGLGICTENPVFDGFADEIVFWKRAIQRFCPQNANLLTESVLLHTLSFIGGSESMPDSKSSSLLENILFYTDNNYSNPDLSLKKIADIYAYTDKYISHLFKAGMNINWSAYLSRLRVQHSLRLIDGGVTVISELSEACGYRDPMYFSKVFKKLMGKTPREYIDLYVPKTEESPKT
jgi:AraC-like DNA-binding protein